MKIQTTTKIATLATALTVLVQILARIFPDLDLLVSASICAMFLAIAITPKFLRFPVEWVLSAVLILLTANGGTNITANILERPAQIEVSIIQEPSYAFAGFHLEFAEFANVTNKPIKVVRW